MGLNMNLAIILGIFMSVAYTSPPPGLTSSNSARQDQQDVSASQAQAPPAQTSDPTQPSNSSSGQTQNPPAEVKPTPKRSRHRKKPLPNCSWAPTALNPAVSAPAESANSQIPVSTNDRSTTDSSAKDASTNQALPNAGSANAGSANAGSANAAPAALPPCPPPKKVIRNGGSSEPTVQLKGGTEQAWQQSSTEQLVAATKENLKKIDGRELNASQQEMVNQIKQFIEQSQKAVAAGDVQRGHSLASKARLLSDELVKP